MRNLTLPVLAALALVACSDDGGSTAVTTAPPAASDTTVPTEITPTPDTGADTTVADTSSAPPVSVGEVGAVSTEGVAAAAQTFIDEGDLLGPCPFDPAGVAAAVGSVLPMVPEFDGPIEDDGQVFSGGDVDIVYCQIRPDAGAYSTTGGVVDMRVDVHPGVADVATYLDEEWGDLLDGSDSVEAAGGTLTTGCLDEFRCLAMWQGADVFVGLMVEATDTATAQQAADGVLAVLPVVVDGLLNGR